MISTKENKRFLLDSFHREKYYLTILGCYQVDDDKTTLRKTMFYISQLFNIIICTAQLIALILVIYFNMNDMSIIIATLYYGTTHTASWFKMLNIVYKWKTLRKIENLINEPIFVKQERFISRTPAIFAKIYRAVCVLSLLGYALFPSTEICEGVFVPIPGWYPVDVATYVGTMDCMSVAMMQLAADKFDALYEDMRMIDWRDEMEEVLKQKIYLHNKILSYVDLVDELLQNGIFVQFMASMGVICLTCFQMMYMSIGAELIALLAYFLVMLAQVSVYCYFGHIVMEKSLDIGEACYMSNWYECGPNIRKLFFILMERSKRPSNLTAGKILILNLSTLVQILRSSYSFFAVLQTIVDD